MKFHETPVKVRFNEVDSYNVAWHGHYVAWMEAGRNDVAGRFGLNADQVTNLGFFAPVVSLELHFKKPARFDEDLRVLTSVRRTNTATIEFTCSIVDACGVSCAEGKTVHVLTDRDGVLQYRLPPIVAERLEKLMAYLAD
ncbi:MAG: acyl-CoA thioesterase [Geobacteraceae bacterium]|jgi:acyl-CoA thioester hydrolase|nr:acyl-CoA thioesterase [Geobacteraceae bacterium]